MRLKGRHIRSSTLSLSFIIRLKIFKMYEINIRLLIINNNLILVIVDFDPGCLMSCQLVLCNYNNLKCVEASKPYTISF